MMKNRIFFAVSLLLMHLCCRAQIGGDYNPANPSDPQGPVLSYQLSLVAKPANSGSFNLSNERLAVGSSNSLRAYTKTGFVFKHWMIGDSILSTNQNMDFVMPAHDVQIVGQFEYNPANPANPGSNYWNKNLGEVIVDDFIQGNLNSAVSTVISGSNSNDVTMITVAGKMNDNDFGIANYYANCTLLDLSRVAGVTAVPSYAFDKTNLESVYLPATIEKIGSRAFYDCKQLQSLTVYALTPPTLDRDVFTGVPDGLVVYVPAAAIAQYQDADGWKDFNLLPIQEDIRNISVSLPENANAADYAQMWLELTNTKSGQRIHYVMTDRTLYTFANIIRNTSWNAVLRNQRGDVFGQINGIDLKDEDVSVTFASLAKPQNVSMSVVTPDGKDVTAQTQVTWTDKEGNYLAQSYNLNGLLPATQLGYRVVLSQELAMQYSTPVLTEYTVSADGNHVKCQLDPIRQVQLTGRVKDFAAKSALGGAIVSASQTFGGKYNKTVSTKTDDNGNYTLAISNVPTSLAIAATNYISQTIVCDTLMKGTEPVAIPEVSLKPITGAVITLGFTYTPSVAVHEEADTQNWYSDYNNVSYTIFNKTKQQNISQFNVQYSQIVLLEEVEEGDVLELTATSRTSAFMPVVVTTVIDAEQRANATFDIVELGKIQADFEKNSNAAVVGSLYDANGKLLKSYDYSSTSLTISNLADGMYTLVSMGNSKFFNTVYDLSQLPQTGLVLGSDYTQSVVEVRSGVVSMLNIDEVPTFDERKLYYTGDNTSFTVNKSSIVVGNYLTLTGHLDFKPAYATSVSNVNLIVDLPESCSFVENSVMVGNSTSSYTLNGTRLTIPMARYTDRVRFCVIPTVGGTCRPSAFVQFTYDNNTIMQPIGATYFNAKNLDISVPLQTADSVIVVNGTAQANCIVKVYDSNVLICQTRSLANGSWSAKVNLYNPYSHSFHNIYAEISTINGNTLLTDTKLVEFDKNMTKLKSITMLYGSNTIVFDQIEGKTSTNYYSYVPSRTDFTFIAQFTKNDTTLIKNLEFKVLATDGTTRRVASVFSPEHNAWVGKATYDDSRKIPTNVSAEYAVISVPLIDSLRIATDRKNFKEMVFSNVLNVDTTKFRVVESSVSMVIYQYQTKTMDSPVYIRQQLLDYEKWIGYVENKDSYMVENNGKSMHFSDVKSDDSYTCWVWSETDQTLLQIDFSDINNFSDYVPNAVVKRAPSWCQTLLENYDLLNIFGILDIINEYNNGFEEYQYWLRQYNTTLANHYKIYQQTQQMLNARCKDGSLRLQPSIYELFEIFVSSDLTTTNSMHEEFKINLDRMEADLIGRRNIASTLSALFLLSDIFNRNPTIGDVNANQISRFTFDWITEYIGDKIGSMEDQITELIDMILYDWFTAEDMANWFYSENARVIKAYTNTQNNIVKAYGKCPESPEDQEDDNPDYLTPPLRPSIDPSGYVYEGVSSNRLEGVTATCYYKETVEDMYGDLHENIVKWDASEYAQENPLFTDKHGMYRWDVPQGLWQVKFEKEGYETTYSEWLPVPPPQLEVNVAMKQNVQPNVKNARAYEDAVEVEFDKYMMPELLNTKNIIVTANGKHVEGTIELLNEEASYENEAETFASKVRFNAVKPFNADEVTVTVNNRVKSYAGIRMQDNFSQFFKIEQEIRKIVCDSVSVVDYGKEGILTVAVLPVSASAGKTLNVSTSSSMILGTDVTNVVLDENGHAEISVTGELPGSATVTFTIDGYDLSGTTIVKVKQIDNKTVAAPTANIASCTTVKKGTEITLSCATEGATIYYTLDGSCPCNATAGRKVYDGTPIIINESVTVKAMAAMPDMYESDVAEFTYIVENENNVNEVTLNEGLQIYPLPVRDKLNVTAGGKVIKNVRLTNTSGTTVVTATRPVTFVSLDVSALTEGVYIINVATEDKTYSRKILKIR